MTKHFPGALKRERYELSLKKIIALQNIFVTLVTYFTPFEENWFGNFQCNVHWQPNKQTAWWAVVVAQLVERLLPTP